MGTLADQLAKLTGVAMPEDSGQKITIPAHLAPREVVSRTKLWADPNAVVAINIPENAKVITPETPDFKYVQLPPRPVEGGLVNVYLHDDDPARKDPSGYRGKKISATLEVWEKVFDNGKKFLYIDLRPAPTGKQATHTFKVSGSTIPEAAQASLRTAGQAGIDIPPPMRGAIIIAPIGRQKP